MKVKSCAWCERSFHVRPNMPGQLYCSTQCSVYAHANPRVVEQRQRYRERRKDPAWQRDPIHGPMSDWFAKQEPWSREAYERVCGKGRA